MTRTAPFAALMALVAAPALAGGAADPVAPPVYVPSERPAALDWTGLYVGGQLEYGIAESGPTDLEGGNLGLFSGYRHDFGTFVVGAEFDWIASGIEVTSGGVGGIDEIARAMVEVGYDLGNTLVYGTAGIVAMTVSPSAPFDDDDIGFVGGIGVDHRLGGNAFLSAELLYHEISDFSGSGQDVTATTLGVGLGLQF